MMCSINASLRKHRMRTKYNNIAKANLTYRTFFIHQLIQYLSGGVGLVFYCLFLYR